MARSQSQTEMKRWQRTGLGGAGLAVLGAILVVQQAVALTGSSFEASDGNKAVDTPGQIDWNTVAFEELSDESQTKADDSISASEDDTVVTVSAGSVQPNKSDLTKVLSYSERTGAGTDFLYLAWERFPTAEGVMAIDFELNQKTQGEMPGAGESWALDRTDGDKLIVFEMTRGGATPTISLLTWDDAVDGACEKSGQTTPCWGPAAVLDATTSPAAEAMVNTPGDIVFGELAIDLVGAGIFEAGECTSFASLYVKSRSSGSSLANQISDVVKPKENRVSNCGSITTTKDVTGPVLADDATSFGFTVACPGVDVDAVLPGVQATKAFSLSDGGSQKVDGIPVGADCTVTEAEPAPGSHWITSHRVDGGAVQADDLSATVVDVGLAGHTVAFTNTRLVGDLTISKTTSGGSGTFTFEVDCTGTTFDRTLAGENALTVATSGSTGVQDIPVGASCAVTEVADPLFTATRTPSDGTISIDADGETVAFTNVRKVASLTITKATTGGDGSFSFAVDCSVDTFDRAAVIVTTAGGAGSSTPISGIPTGTTCRLTETVPAGWAAVGGTTRDVTIDVDGEIATFTNEKLTPGIDVTKQASAPVVHRGDVVTYTYVVTNAGETALTDVGLVDDKCTTVTGPAAGNDVGADGVLGLTEAWTFTCSQALLATTLNTASATGTDPLGVEVTNEAAATVAVITSAITIDKSPSVTSMTPGTTVLYTYVVTNGGDVALSAVSVSDDKCSPVSLASGDANGDGLLQVAETWVFLCSQVQTGAADTATNVGTASGTDPLGVVVEATDTVTVSVVAPLVLEQPAPRAAVVAAPIGITAPTARAAAPSPAPVPSATAPARLPRTGIDVSGGIQLGTSLLVLGVSLLFTSRSRNRRRTA